LAGFLVFAGSGGLDGLAGCLGSGAAACFISWPAKGPEAAATGDFSSEPGIFSETGLLVPRALLDVLAGGVKAQEAQKKMRTAAAVFLAKVIKTPHVFTPKNRINHNIFRF